MRMQESRLCKTGERIVEDVHSFMNNWSLSASQQRPQATDRRLILFCKIRLFGNPSPGSNTSYTSSFICRISYGRSSDHQVMVNKKYTILLGGYHVSKC